MSWVVVRRLAVLAADERTPMNERIVAALEACRRISREEMLGVEEHQKPTHRIRRVDGPLYLRKEQDGHYLFVFWRGWYVGGIPGAAGDLSLPAEACTVSWMSDEEKRARLGCCPSQPVAAWVDVAVSL